MRKGSKAKGLEGRGVKRREADGLNVAERLFNQGDYRGSEQMLAMLADSPRPSTKARASYWLGHVMGALGHPGQATFFFEQSALLAEPDEAPDLLLDLAARWDARGHSQRAADTYQRVACFSTEPGLASVAGYRLGRLKLDRGEHVAAASWWSRSLTKAEPELRPHLLLELGRLLVERESAAESLAAVVLLAAAIGLDHPDSSPEAGLLLAQLLIARESYSEAYRLLDQVAASEHPEHGPAASDLRTQVRRWRLRISSATESWDGQLPLPIGAPSAPCFEKADQPTDPELVELARIGTLSRSGTEPQHWRPAPLLLGELASRLGAKGIFRALPLFCFDGSLPLHLDAGGQHWGSGSGPRIRLLAASSLFGETELSCCYYSPIAATCARSDSREPKRALTAFFHSEVERLAKKTVLLKAGGVAEQAHLVDVTDKKLMLLKRLRAQAAPQPPRSEA